MFCGFENAVESGQTAKARTHGDFGNGNIRLDQQRFRVVDPFPGQIFIAGDAGELLEQPGEMKFGKTGEVSQIIHVDIFCAMVGDIVADIHKFFNIFVLFVRCNAGEFLAGIEVGAADGNEKADDQ